MNIIQLGGGNLFPFRFEVGYLAGDQLQGAGGERHLVHDFPVGVACPTLARRGDFANVGITASSSAKHIDERTGCAFALPRA